MIWVIRGCVTLPISARFGLVRLDALTEHSVELNRQRREARHVGTRLGLTLRAAPGVETALVLLPRRTK